MVSKEKGRRMRDAGYCPTRRQTYLEGDRRKCEGCNYFYVAWGCTWAGCWWPTTRSEDRRTMNNYYDSLAK